MDVNVEEISSKLEEMDNSKLLNFIASLETLLTKTRDILSKKTPAAPPTHHHADPNYLGTKFQELFSFQAHPLDNVLVGNVHAHVKGLTYHPSSSNPTSPEIHLYGEHPYSYNRESSKVTPTPLSESPVMTELLQSVNTLLDTDYNSILVNKYRNYHTHLAPHKDDEPSLDPSSPISGLSLGANRRMQFSYNKDKNKVKHTVSLTPWSLNTMMPGFQDLFYHSIAPGRNSVKKEKGVRYSITFRRIIVQASDTIPPSLPNHHNADAGEEEEEKEEEEEEEIPVDDKSSPDTLVFGSSLTKGMDEDLLSKHSKTFRVLSKPGAKVADIHRRIEGVASGAESIGIRDLGKVTAVFLVCGGNDVGRLAKDSYIENVYKDYENLVSYTRTVFPNAAINIVSLLPRRSSYNTHVDNMRKMNMWLHNFCLNNYIRFVNICSHFLTRTFLLNDKLFSNDEVHFSKIGISVLAKVLIGVANSPRALG